MSRAVQWSSKCKHIITWELAPISHQLTWKGRGGEGCSLLKEGDKWRNCSWAGSLKACTESQLIPREGFPPLLLPTKCSFHLVLLKQIPAFQTEPEKEVENSGLWSYLGLALLVPVVVMQKPWCCCVLLGHWAKWQCSLHARDARGIVRVSTLQQEGKVQGCSRAGRGRAGWGLGGVDLGSKGHIPHFSVHLTP